MSTTIRGRVEGPFTVLRVVDYRSLVPLILAGNFVMRCYELEDGRLLRIDTMEEWIPSDDHTFLGEVPTLGSDVAVRGAKVGEVTTCT